MISYRKWLLLLVRLLLGGLFIYAGAMKLNDPLSFADSIGSFRILPLAAVSPMALGLPFFEIASGVLIIAPPGRRLGALAILILSAIFFVALLSAWARGLDVNCGCFGGGGPKSSIPLELIRDLLLVFGALAVWLYPMQERRAA